MIEDLLTVEIYLGTPTQDEIEYLVKAEEACRLALDKFLAQQISLQDYFDILQLAGVNIDDYLLTLENNLIAVGIT